MWSKYIWDYFFYWKATKFGSENKLPMLVLYNTDY